MGRKRALITVSLIDESVDETNAKIARELLEWFREDAIAVPWIKNVEGIIVRE